MPTLTDTLAEIEARGAELYIDEGRLRWRGPVRAPNDPIRAAIAEHRDELVSLLQAPTPLYRCVILGCHEPIGAGDLVYCPEHRRLADNGDLWAPRPEGWSDRLDRLVYEPVPDQPGCWQETPASAALCIWCSAPLAEGDKLACPEHRLKLEDDPALAKLVGRGAR